MSHEITNFYELANKNQVSLPVPLNSIVYTVFHNNLGCDYYSCKKMFDSLQQTRDTSKSLLRSFNDSILNAISSIIANYEKGNVFIADSAIRLKQVVSYELISLQKQNKENKHIIEQIANRITELKRNLSRKEETIASLCKEWNISVIVFPSFLFNRQRQLV